MSADTPARRSPRRRRAAVVRALAGPTALALAVAGVAVLAAGRSRLPDAAQAGAREVALPAQPRQILLVCPGPGAGPHADAGGDSPSPSPTVSPSPKATPSPTVTDVVAGQDGVGPGTLTAAAVGGGSGARDDLAVQVVPMDRAAGVLAGAAAATRGGNVLTAAAQQAAETQAVAVLARPAPGSTIGGIVPAALRTASGITPLARGLRAAACRPAISRAWLVGGATTAGHATRVELSNPASQPAVVHLRVLGPKGAVALSTGDAITVPAGGTVSRLLEEFAPAMASVVVEVVTASGRVTATLHDGVVRGLTAGGADDVGPAASPRRVQVVPGVVVAAEADRAALPADADDEEDPGSGSDPAAPDASAGPDRRGPDRRGADAPGATAVRVAVPGGRPAAVRISLIGPDGPLRLPGGAVAVPAGASRDVVVRDVPDGTYAAVVSADVPVVAGAVSGRTRADGDLAGTSAGYGRPVPPSELAWSAGAGDLPTAATLVAVGESADTRLVLAAPAGAAKLGYRLVGRDGSLGAPTTLDVAAHSTAELDLPTGVAGVLVSARGRLVAALVLGDEDAAGPLLSVVPVVSLPAGGVAARQARAEPRLGLAD